MAEQITLADGTVIPVDYVPKGASPDGHALPAQPLPPAPVSIPPVPPLPPPGLGAPVPNLTEQQVVAMLTGPPEVWCGYQSDRSEVVLFPGEVEALRWAVECSGKVGKVAVDGTSVWHQLDI